VFCDAIFGPVKQWGFLVKDLDEAMAGWVEQLGVGPWRGYRNVSVTSHFQGSETEVTMDVGLAFQGGVQIELIQQTNDVASPYRAFYETNAKQTLHQVAYFAKDIEESISKATKLGMREVGSITTLLDTRYVYMDSPAMEGLVIELMEIHEGFEEEFDRGVAEAERWNGSDPYRLVSMT
jgi:methylmalonyl-CoA/ethylmalonyl-CoA epimerase